MDLESRKKISDLIKDATSTGTLTLSNDHIQQFKLILKQSNSNVKSAFDLLMDRLKYKHAQVRISTINIINEIFMRSKYFRELLCGVLSTFFELTLGINGTQLPPPVNSVSQLKAKTLEYIEKWNESYGAHYSLLRNGFYYLKNSLRLNFPEIRANAIQRDREENERKERTQSLLKLKYERFKNEFQEISTTIDNLINDMETIFNDLIPDPSTNFEDLFGSDDEDYKEDLKRKEKDNFENQLKDQQEQINSYQLQQQQQDDESGIEIEFGNDYDNEEQLNNNGSIKSIDHSNIIKEGGFGSLNYAIEVSVNPDDTKENLDKEKLESLSEKITELEKIQNLVVNDWYSTLIKININTHSDPQYSNYLRKVIEIQSKINSTKLKSKDIDILPFNNNNNNNNQENNNSNQDENEFEGVEMEEFTMDQIQDKTTTTTTTTTSTAEKEKENNLVYKPYYKRDIKPVSVEELPEEESVEELLKRAPIVPMNTSLLFWGQKEISLDNGINREHRFLGDSYEPTISIDNFNMLNQFTYTVEDEAPVTIPCNFPLKNGKLCPRRDISICPFHGKIIPRDDKTGEPIIDNQNDDGDKNQEADEEDQLNNSNNSISSTTTTATTPTKKSQLNQDLMIPNPLFKTPSKNDKPKKRRPNSKLIDIKAENDTTKSKIDKILKKQKVIIEEKLL